MLKTLDPSSERKPSAVPPRSRREAPSRGDADVAEAAPARTAAPRALARRKRRASRSRSPAVAQPDAADGDDRATQAVPPREPQESKRRAVMPGCSTPSKRKIGPGSTRPRLHRRSARTDGAPHGHRLQRRDASARARPLRLRPRASSSSTSTPSGEAPGARRRRDGARGRPDGARRGTKPARRHPSRSRPRRPRSAAVPPPLPRGG